MIPPLPMEAVSAVGRALDASWLIPRGAVVVVAVSGGVDSVVLLDVLTRLAPKRGFELSVAHFDHRLRADSGEDVAFVEALAEKRRLPCLVGRAEEDLRTSDGEGLAARARRARYRFLVQAAGKLGAGLVATGHTASDQAETFLLRLLRGTGSLGLAGIPVRRSLAPGIAVVRPLIGLTRADVLRHGRRFRLAWREDPSNLSPERLRNRVRREVIPLLATLQPEVERVLARAASQAREASQILRRRVRRGLSAVTREEVAGGLVLEGERWRQLPVELGRWVMKEAIGRVSGVEGLSAAHVEAACAVARRGRGRALLGRAEVEASTGQVRIIARALPGK